MLLVSHGNRIGLARLPYELGRAGLAVDLIFRPPSYTAASSAVRERHAVSGGPAALVESLRQELERRAVTPRVIPADEDVLQALLARRTESWVAGLLGDIVHDGLEACLDKTAFSERASGHGLPVPDHAVCHSSAEATQAAARIGFPVIVKGRFGFAGSAVRAASDTDAVRSACDELDMPVLVQRRENGRVCLAPSLYERGRLVAYFACAKTRTSSSEFGPSSANTFVDPEGLEDLLRAVGPVFGLHGFAGVDFVVGDDGSLTLLEVNPRPVPQLHLGRRVGVDMGAMLARSGDGDAAVGRPARSSAYNPLFPQLPIDDLKRRRFGRLVLDLADPRLWRDIPWQDRRLLRAYAGRLGTGAPGEG